MRKIRVYVDTSVFGGTQDEEFSEASLRFFERVSRGDFRILLSPETLRELSRAPEPVRVVWRQLSLESIEEVLINEEVAELARSYIRANVLGAASEADSLHVAAATFAGADLILSWNFKHIVNYDRIRGFNAVNIANGYRSMTILSPREVILDEEK